MPVLYGVFLYMGVSSLKGMQLVHRVMIVFMPGKYQPDYMFLRHVPVKRVHLFTFIQIMCLALLWTVKTIKQISIVFPLMVSLLSFSISMWTPDIDLIFMVDWLWYFHGQVLKSRSVSPLPCTLDLPFLVDTLIMEGTCPPDLWHMTLTSFSWSTDFGIFMVKF